MMIRYKVKRTQFVCPEDWYIGGCPLTGQYLRVQIGELSQDQLKAWLQNDPANAGKYVTAEEVPETEETKPKRKRRKPSKNKVNGKQAETAAAAKAETPQNAGNTSERMDN
jgi:NADH:ubiquinone oxidoreductase subunit B-like Fe-S oxidoreductase